MTTAALYLRISHDPDMTGEAIERQREDCRSRADALGWDVVAEYVDQDVSADEGKHRPAWTDLLVDAQDGTFSAVVAWHDDRLWRNVVEQQTVFEHLAESGVKYVATESSRYDTSSADDSVISGMQALLAQKENADKKRRLRRQRAQHAKSGKPNYGGRRPFGYESDGLTIRETEAEIVREAADRYLGGESLRTIARDLNDREVTTASGKTWRTTSLRTVLSGPRIAGLRVHHHGREDEQIYEADWPAIIDRATHEKLRSAFNNPRRVQRGRPAEHLLTGMLACHKCGETLHHSYRSDNGSRRYACTSTPGTDACGGTSVTAEDVEQAVATRALAALTSDWLAETVRKLKADDQDDDPAAELETVQSKREELASMWAADEITRREWTDARDRLDDREQAARRKLADRADAPVLAELPRTAEALADAWQDAGMDRKRTILRAVVSRVEVGPGIVDGSRQTPADRIAIDWRI